MDKKVKLLFEDMAINSEYKLLEYGKDDDLLKEIATKKGIVLPSKDLAIFKCKYAMIDEENRNRCTLPRKEVKKALKTLVGKAIDKDHLRQNTIGYWLDSEIEDNDIVSYGAFWKSNFPEDYEEIQKRMQEGKVKVSFEAWGEREFKGNTNSYDLTNIEFAGGALLFDTEPAFPDAEVLDFASKRETVLEFAKVVEEAKKYQCGKCKKELSVSDTDKDVMCPECSEKMTDVKLKEDMDTVDEKEPRDEAGKTKEGKSPISEGNGDSKEVDNKTGGNIKVEELLKKYNKSSIEELVKYFDESIVSLTSKETELASLKAEKETLLKDIEESKLKLENSSIELEKVKVEATAIKEQLDARLAAEKAAIVQAKRDELGEEFAKDLSDEDLLNDLKFENAKLKKELAAVKQEKGSVTKPEEGLEAGKKIEGAKSETFARQELIQKKAFV